MFSLITATPDILYFNKPLVRNLFEFKRASSNVEKLAILPTTPDRSKHLQGHLTYVIAHLDRFIHCTRIVNATRSISVETSL